METETPAQPAQKPPMIVESTWEEFAQAGLFWWVNRALHLFGWALVREMDDDGPDAKILRVYPARCRFRGFSEEVESDGFKRLTAHLQTNVPELVRHTKEEGTG